MKDVMASLPEVIKEYKGYNLLIPTATDVQLNPFYKSMWKKLRWI